MASALVRPSGPPPRAQQGAQRGPRHVGQVSSAKPRESTVPDRPREQPPQDCVEVSNGAWRRQRLPGGPSHLRVQPVQQAQRGPQILQQIPQPVPAPPQAEANAAHPEVSPAPEQVDHHGQRATGDSHRGMIAVDLRANPRPRRLGPLATAPRASQTATGQALEIRVGDAVQDSLAKSRCGYRLEHLARSPLQPLLQRLGRHEHLKHLSKTAPLPLARKGHVVHPPGSPLPPAGECVALLAALHPQDRSITTPLEGHEPNGAVPWSSAALVTAPRAVRSNGSTNLLLREVRPVARELSRGINLQLRLVPLAERGHEALAH